MAFTIPSDCNGTRNYNYLVRKRTLNHLAKWLSVRLQTKWLSVRVPLQSLKLQISRQISRNYRVGIHCETRA